MKEKSKTKGSKKQIKVAAALLKKIQTDQDRLIILDMEIEQHTRHINTHPDENSEATSELEKFKGFKIIFQERFSKHEKKFKKAIKSLTPDALNCPLSKDDSTTATSGNTGLETGDTLLVRAMISLNLNVVQKLISKGANPTLILESGRYKRCSAFYAAMLKLLKIEKKILVVKPTTPLTKKALGGEEGVRTCLRDRMIANRIEKIEEMLKIFDQHQHRPDLNAVERIAATEKAGAGHEAVLFLLHDFKTGYKPDRKFLNDYFRSKIQSKNSTTCLQRMQKIAKQHYDTNPAKQSLTSEIIQHADAHSRTNPTASIDDLRTTTTPMFAIWLSVTGYLEEEALIKLLELFKEYGADFNQGVYDRDGYCKTSPLEIAAKKASLAVVKYLIENRASTEQTSGYTQPVGTESTDFIKLDYTPYCFALSAGRFDVAEHIESLSPPPTQRQLGFLVRGCILKIKQSPDQDTIDQQRKIIKYIIEKYEYQNLCIKLEKKGVTSVLEIIIEVESELINKKILDQFEFSQLLIKSGYDINFSCPVRGSILRHFFKLSAHKDTASAALKAIGFCLDNGASLQQTGTRLDDFKFLLRSKHTQIIQYVCKHQTIDLKTLRIHDKMHGQISILHYVALHYNQEEAKGIIALMKGCADILTDDENSAADLAFLSGKYLIAFSLHLKYHCSLTPGHKLDLIAALISQDKMVVTKLVDETTWITVGDYAFTPRSLAIHANKEMCIRMLGKLPEGIRYQGQDYQVPEGHTLKLVAHNGSFIISMKENKQEEEIVVYEPPIAKTPAQSGYAYCLEHGIKPGAVMPAEAAAPATVAESVAPVSWLSSPKEDDDVGIQIVRGAQLNLFLVVDHRTLASEYGVEDLDTRQAKLGPEHLKPIAGKENPIELTVEGVGAVKITHELKIRNSNARILCYPIHEDGKTLLVAAVYAPKGLHTSADKDQIQASLRHKVLTAPSFEAAAGASPTSM